jgi:hypothetical protein
MCALTVKSTPNGVHSGKPLGNILAFDQWFETTVPSYTPPLPSNPPPKLLDRVRDRIRRLGYAKRTELSYAHWIKRYIIFHGKRHPEARG